MSGGRILFRSILFLLGFYGLTPWWAILLLLSLPFSRQGLLARGIRVWCDLVFWLLRVVANVRIDIRERNNLPAEGPYIVAAKHQSTIDAFFVFRHLPDVTALGKRELFLVPVLGSILRKIGVAPVARGSGTAHRTLPDHDNLFIREQRVLVIFPEATRVPVGETVPLRPGIFHYYRDTGLPVIPLTTNAGCFWPAKGWRLKPGTATYAFGAPLPAGLDQEAFMKALDHRLIEASDALCRQATD